MDSNIGIGKTSVPLFLLKRQIEKVESQKHAKIKAIGSYLYFLLTSLGFYYCYLLLSQSFLSLSFLSLPEVSSQTVEAKDGALIWAIPGATLSFNSTSGCEGNINGAVSIVSQEDLRGAINNTVTLILPQVR